MKKQYVNAEFELVRFGMVDIIMASGGTTPDAGDQQDEFEDP